MLVGVGFGFEVWRVVEVVESVRIWLVFVLERDLGCGARVEPPECEERAEAQTSSVIQGKVVCRTQNRVLLLLGLSPLPTASINNGSSSAMDSIEIEVPSRSIPIDERRRRLCTAQLKTRPF